MSKYVLATHVNPDYDGLSSIVGFINAVSKKEYIKLWNLTFNRNDVFDVYIPCKILNHMSWLLKGCNVCNNIDHNYDGLIVFDSIPDNDRINIPKDLYKYYFDNNAVYSIDHHIDKKNKNRIQYDLPSTTCCLIHEGVLDDVFYLGIYSDTFSFNYNIIKCLPYLNKLIDNGLTSEKICQYNSHANPIRSIDYYNDLKSNIDIKKRLNGDNVILWIKTINRLINNNSFYEIVNYFKSYCDFLIVSDRYTNKISFRSQNLKYNACKVAQRIDGHGHFHAAGSNLVNVTDYELEQLFNSL